MPRRRKDTLVLEKEEESEQPQITEVSDSENSFNEQQSESEYEEDLLKKALNEENDNTEEESEDNNEEDNNEEDSGSGEESTEEQSEDDNQQNGHPQMDPMMNIMNQMFGGMMPPHLQQQANQQSEEEDTDLTDILSVFFHDSNDKNVVEVLGEIKTSIDKNSKCILKLTQVLQDYLSKK